MRKNIFIKQNGVLPETPFKKGDIVTYVDLDRSTQPHKVVSKEIMILDHIRHHLIYTRVSCAHLYLININIKMHAQGSLYEADTPLVAEGSHGHRRGRVCHWKPRITPEVL